MRSIFLFCSAHAANAVAGKNAECSFKTDLNKWLLGVRRIVVAGIGNPIRRDDFVGMRIVQNLRKNCSEKTLLIECETVPESYLQDIVEFDPTHVVLIDAAILGLKPGEYRLFSPSMLFSSSAISTHILPLRIFCDLILQMTKAKIGLLLIEPRETDFGEDMSPEVVATENELTKILAETLSTLNLA